MTLSSDHCFKQQDNCYGYFNSFAHNISVSPLSCVSCFPPHVSIFGLFPVLVSSHYELSMFQLCVCDYVLITLYI